MEAQRLDGSDDSWRVRFAVANGGYLPAYVTRRAKQRHRRHPQGPFGRGEAGRSLLRQAPRRHLGPVPNRLSDEELRDKFTECADS